MEVFINASSSADLTKSFNDFVHISIIFYFLIIFVSFYFVAVSLYKR